MSRCDCGHDDGLYPGLGLYARDGSTLCFQCWGDRLVGDRDERLVAVTDLGISEVSTVWLGIDHNWTRQGPPLIFETMVFSADEELDGMGWRYPTEAAALAGHDQIVAWLKHSGKGEMPSVEWRTR